MCLWFFCEGCCDYGCCDPKDDWNVTDEIRPGEHAAGFLYKRAKNSAVWSKRYCSLTDQKLTYYLERDRLVMKGEIVLAGASVVESPTRAHTRNQWFFNINHPQCGTREFYARSRKRRSQWIEKLTDVIREVTKVAAYGKLKKLGGANHNVWQERWCICTGRSFDYFDLPTDNQSKGTIDLLHATIRDYEQKAKFNVEITPAPIPSHKKSKSKDKKYVFQFDNESEQLKWLKVMERGSKPLQSLNINQSSNPMHAKSSSSSSSSSSSTNAGAMAATSSGDEDYDMMSTESIGRDSVSTLASEDLNKGSMLRTLSAGGLRVSESMKPTDMAGYMMKKSPALLKGWQKRYFRTMATGDVEYYKTESDANNESCSPQGVIKLSSIKRDVGLEMNDKTFEITIHTDNKTILLKALSNADAVAWASSIAAWMDANSKVGFTMGHIEMQNSSSNFDMTYDEDDMYG